MTTKPTSEKAFENAIEAWLLEQAGYTRAAIGHYRNHQRAVWHALDHRR